MSKNEKRKWNSKKKKGKKTKSKDIAFKSNTPKVPLKKKLADIYTEVNLETTCSGRCECCKVAMPQMNYCEFLQVLNEIWKTEDNNGKIDIIKTSIEYFFRHDFATYYS